MPLTLPEPPGTHRSGGEAVVAALNGENVASAECQGLTWYPTPPPDQEVTLAGGVKSIKFSPVPDLPPDLQDRGYIRAVVCATRRHHKHKTRGEAITCGTLYYARNPWVDCTTQRTLMALGDGTRVLYEHPCLFGYGATELKAYNLDGTYRCSIFTAITSVPDPKLPDIGGGGTPPPGLPFSLEDIKKLAGGGGGSLDLSEAVRVLAALVLTAGDVRGSLDQLPPGLAQRLGPGFQDITSALDLHGVNLADRMQQALDGHGDTTANEYVKVGANIVAAVIPGMAGIMNAMVGDGAQTLKEIPNLFKKGADKLLEAMLTVFRDNIEGGPAVDPSNVDQKAAQAMRAALLAGVTAHLLSLGLELLHPVKHMGVPQLVGVLADFAGFDRIGRPFFDATLRYGIGLPAEHRAAKHFRTRLPPVEVTRELAAIHPDLAEKYRERLELEGFPDPYPEALVDIRFTPPPARFLAQLLEGSETDEPWLIEQFRRLGFSPANIERATRAMVLKTTAPGRSRLVSAWLTAYQRGQVQEAELDQGLELGGLSVRHRAVYKRVAILERRAFHMEAVATATLTQYRNSVVSRAAAQQMLTGLGYAPDEVTARLLVTDLEREAKVVKDEAQQIEVEIRQVKAAALKNAALQLRAGFLDRATFVAGGQGMGYSRAYLQNVADLELAKGPPTSLPGQPAIGTGALEEARARITQLLGEKVALGQVDRLHALVVLQGLGLPTDLATTLMDIAEALQNPTPRAGHYGFPTGGKVSGSFAHVLEQVLGGLGLVGDPRTLVSELLRALGLPARTREALDKLIEELRALFHR